MEEQFIMIKKYYNGRVKPNLKKDSLFIAHMEFGNLLDGLVRPAKYLIKKYASGYLFLTTCALLENKFNEISQEEYKEVPEILIKKFESYMTQLGMSIKTNNRF